jgi:hypothetical protein|tara:strand:+ start:11626 stop:12054 length:429 start_codon:yes stop_codon:yes gene_type:complete
LCDSTTVATVATVASRDASRDSARRSMFNACAPAASRCGRNKGAKPPKPEWAESFERFRKERGELTREQAEKAWEAQKTAMLQEEEVATRLYAEMDVLEGTSGGRTGNAAATAELVSENVRRASPTAADVEQAKRADANPFK